MESGQPSLLMAMVMMMMGMGVNSFPFCTESGLCIKNYEEFKWNMQTMEHAVFLKYQVFTRPSTGFPDPVPIEVSVSLVHIRGLDAGKQELESVLDLTVKWEDQRMMEGVGLKGFTFKFVSNLEEVWHPHLIYFNGVRAPTPVWNFDPAKVLYTEYGEVTWKQRQIVTTFCDFNPENNTPQSCDIDLGFLFPDDVKFDSSSFSVGPDFSYAGYDVAGNLNSEDKLLKIRLEFAPRRSG